MRGSSAAPRLVPEGIRATKVGVWFVLLTLLVGVAGTNTGNNALYMVLAVMLATLVVSGVLSRNNVRLIEVKVATPDELFADTPASFELSVLNHGRYLSRYLVVVSLGDDPSSALISYLPRAGGCQGTIELTPKKRGAYRLDSAHLVSLFPLGFFRKGSRQKLDRDLIVFPRLRRIEAPGVDSSSAVGDLPSRKPGWGHEIHSLRAMRPGDDPRRIHWKQSARTGRMIYLEREAEENRRVSIVLDNALDLSDGAAAEERLEERISEAASSALEYLKLNYEVELITRTATVGFGSGRRQRRRVLEALALLEAAPPNARPLLADNELQVRLEA